ncbi:hypothetical protein BDF22DRAFT_701120 [Syncephalis plumigaleata]|nr:hypothetical protein BDF22DRAFT_701120 [Syncephalis plumigaleata]
MVDIQPSFDSSTELDISVNLDQHSVNLHHCEPHSKMETSTVKDALLTGDIADAVNQDVVASKALSHNEVIDDMLLSIDDSEELPTLDETNNDNDDHDHADADEDDLLEMNEDDEEDEEQQEQVITLSNTHQPEIDDDVDDDIDAEVAGVLDTSPLLLSSSHPASPLPVATTVDATITDLQDDSEQQLLLDIDTTKEMVDVESTDDKVLSSSLPHVSQLMSEVAAAVEEEEEEEEEVVVEEKEAVEGEQPADMSTTAEYQVDKEILDQVPCIHLQHQGAWYSMFRADPSKPEQEVFFNQNDELALYYCDLSQFTQTLKESYMLEDREVTLEIPYLELLLIESSSYMHDYTLRDIYQMYKALWLTVNEVDTIDESFEPLRILLMDRPNAQEQLTRLRQLVENGPSLSVPAVASTDNSHPSNNNDQSKFDDVASSIIDTWEEEMANITGNSSSAQSPTQTATQSNNDNNEAYANTLLEQPSQHDNDNGDDDDDDDLLVGLDDNPAVTPTAATTIDEQDVYSLEDNTTENVATANITEAEQLLETTEEDSNSNDINNSDDTSLLGSKRHSNDIPGKFICIITSCKCHSTNKYHYIDETDNKRMRQV